MRTSHLRAPLFAALLLMLSAAAAWAVDIGDFENRFSDTLAFYSEYTPGVKQELELIRSRLKNVPESQRVSVLEELAKQTIWGTPERATAYIICAWYGANYERCRDYILNTAFWGDRGFYAKNPKQKPPFCFSEDTLAMLYAIYERNHDFKLLHDLLTGGSDGAGATFISYVRVDAAKDHPRGVLHVAEMSKLGREVAMLALSKYPSLAFGEADEDHNAPAKRIFRTYLIRVASDRKDPLCPLAKSLLKESKYYEAQIKCETEKSSRRAMAS